MVRTEYHRGRFQAAMEPSGPNKYEFRAIGERLRKFRSTVEPGMEFSVIVHAALADLLGEDSGLLMALKDLFSRPRLLEFDFEAAQASAIILREALVAELQAYYTKEVIDVLCSVMNGYLDIREQHFTIGARIENDNASSNAIESPTIGRSRTTRLLIRRGESNHGISIELNKTDKKERTARPVMFGFNHERLLIAVALVAAFSTIAWKSSLICRVLGYCPEYLATQSSKNEFTEAQKALDAAKLADSLDALETSAAKLQILIASLRQQPLTLAQHKSLNEVNAAYEQLNKKVSSEKTNSLLIRNGQALIEAANAEQGKQKETLMSKAKDIIKRIKLIDDSFLVSEFTRLKQALNGKPTKEPAPVADPVRTVNVESGPAAPLRSAQVTSPRISPRPRVEPVQPAIAPATTSPSPDSGCDDRVFVCGSQY